MPRRFSSNFPCSPWVTLVGSSETLPPSLMGAILQCTVATLTMETVGGAAAVPALFQAVLASYSFWYRCRRYGTESNIVLNVLKIEEARFRLWGEKWNLDTSSGQKFFEDFQDQPHVVALVKQSLEQLRLLFEGAQKWGKRLEQAGVNKAQSQAEDLPGQIAFSR